MTLRDWGLSPDAKHELAPGEILARVVEEQKTSYSVIAEEGILLGQLSGKLLHPSVDRLERPVVGDWIAARPLWNEGKAVIQRVLPRTGLLKRKAPETGLIQPLAANVNLTVVVTSLNKEFNEKRLHRYLTVAEDGGSRVAVALTKSDLAPESAATAAELAAKYKVPFVAVCALSGMGLDEIRALWGVAETAVFVGSSGVGKSTLVNALLGRVEQSVGDIREDDDRGRHTTTSRRLISLPNGALVIDTPGMREIQLDAGQSEALEKSFAAIDVLSQGCKFANCAHETEPGCAVKAALEEGTVTAEDHASYVKLRKEMAFQERKTSKSAASEQKQKWKKVTQSMRDVGKRKGRE